MQQQQEKDFTRRLDAGLWLKLAGYLKPYRRLLLLSAAALVVSALCDTIFPLLTREAIDRFVSAGQTAGLAGFAARYAATILVQVASIFANCWLSGRAECGINRHIRLLGFRRLSELPFSYYDQTPVGYIIARMTSDTARLARPSPGA